MLKFFLLFFSIILFSHFSINSFSDERVIVLSCALFRNDRTVPKNSHTDTSSNAVHFMLRLLFLKCFTLFVVVWGLYLRAKLVVYIYIYIHLLCRTTQPMDDFKRASLFFILRCHFHNHPLNSSSHIQENL